MSVEPTISVKTFREKRVTLRWSPEDGPVIEVPYGDNRRAVLTYVRVSHEQGREPHVASAKGYYLKKDGTAGSRDAKIYANNLARFPDEVRVVALTALKGVAW